MVRVYKVRGSRGQGGAERARPIPTGRGFNVCRRKVAGRACPAPTVVDGWRVLAGRGGRHICRPYGVNRQVSYNRERCGRDESLPYGPGRQRLPSQTCGPGMPGPYGVVDGWRVLAGRIAISVFQTNILLYPQEAHPRLFLFLWCRVIIYYV